MIGSDTAAVLTKHVQVSNGTAHLRQDDTIREFEIVELPPKLIRWQLDYKLGIYDAIEKDQYIAFNAGHLPVVGTWDTESLVPNLANKGFGFTPKDEYIDRYLDLVDSAVAQIEKLPSHAVNDTRALRLATAPSLPGV